MVGVRREVEETRQLKIWCGRHVRAGNKGFSVVGNVVDNVVGMLGLVMEDMVW